MRNDSLSGRVCAENLSCLLMFSPSFTLQTICRISINVVDIAGEALIYFPNPICKIYKLSNLYSRGERETKRAKERLSLDKDSCHVLVFVSKTFSELCRGKTEESALPPFILNNHLSKHPQTNLTICTQIS